MGKSLKNKKILIGICGGISAYKSCELIRLLIKSNYEVKVVMTKAATHFINSLVFRTLSKNPVYVEMFSENQKEYTKHISLAEWADLCVVAPISANTLSKVALGICDNLLTAVLCALPDSKKIILIPAMNNFMWKNPLIQENIKKLKKIKRFVLIPPKSGELACGAEGEGRMLEAKEIHKVINSNL